MPQKTFEDILDDKKFDINSLESMEELGKLLFDKGYKKDRSIGQFLEKNLEETIYWIDNFHWRTLRKAKGLIDYDKEKVLPIASSGILVFRTIADDLLDAISEMCYSAEELQHFSSEQIIRRKRIDETLLGKLPKLLTRPFEFIPHNFCRHSIPDMCNPCLGKFLRLAEPVKTCDDAVTRVSIRKIGARDMR